MIYLEIATSNLIELLLITLLDSSNKTLRERIMKKVCIILMGIIDKL